MKKLSLMLMVLPLVMGTFISTASAATTQNTSATASVTKKAATAYVGVTKVQTKLVDTKLTVSGTAVYLKAMTLLINGGKTTYKVTVTKTTGNNGKFSLTVPVSGHPTVALRYNKVTKQLTYKTTAPIKAAAKPVVKLQRTKNPAISPRTTGNGTIIVSAQGANVKTTGLRVYRGYITAPAGSLISIYYSKSVIKTYQAAKTQQVVPFVLYTKLNKQPAHVYVQVKQGNELASHKVAVTAQNMSFWHTVKE